MSSIVRDAPFGQLLRALTGNRVLQYPDELPDFELPAALGPSSPRRQPALMGDEEKALGGGSQSDTSSENEKHAIVEWYSDTDPENPHNWPFWRKAVVFLQICLYSFAVYVGSSIIVAAESDFVAEYGVTDQVSSLVLSMYVLGYGTGPLLFSPLSEVPRLGRNWPYMVSFGLFFIMTIPAAVIHNYPGLVVLRFIQGFLGGPILATGGASAGDLFAMYKLPYATSVWTFASYGGPALGPVLGGFVVQESTWRWTMYEMLIISGAVFFTMLFFMPETNPETILLKRAQRLRKLTGNQNLRSQSEIKEGDIHIVPLILSYLTTPFRVTLQDPAVAFVQVYTALVYAIYYSFFESFPLVYMGIYNMSLGVMGLVFITILIAGALGVVIYGGAVWLVFEPYTLKNGIGVPEYRLIPAVIGAGVLPIGLFLFGWTANDSIHWVVSALGILIFACCAFIILQCIVIYLPTSYPRYAASLFAMNTFLRSATAAGGVHFARPLFENLGIGRGCSILGGLTVGCFLGMLSLYVWGDRLRARSKFAQTY